MKESIGISIIIPCYNVEQYIIKCLESIKNQIINYKYEIILIDDNSTDETKKIIKDYLQKDSNNIIFLENDKNMGAGYSRNKAVEVAKYEYISFIDADDYLDNNFYSEMLKVILETQSDLVACDINISYIDEKLNNLNNVCVGKVSKYNLINNGLAASPCNKIIKKSWLLKYPFAEGIMNEDIASIIAIISNCNKVSVTHNTKYNYVQRNASVQNSPLSNKRLDLFKSLSILEERIKDNPEYEKIMESLIFQQIISFFLYVPIKEKNYFTRAKFLKKFSKQSKKYNLRGNKLYWQFLNNCNLQSRLYYRLLFKLNSMGLSYTISFIISFYSFYRKIKNKKTVIKQDITIDNLIKVAQKQQKLKSVKTISVVIPNYNYARFLYQRIYSILNQNYKINELIILDDCSTDDSQEIIDNIINKLEKYISIKKNYNKKNSGSTFKQWKKAMQLATSEYVWIAEADDYCDKNFLKSLMKFIEQDEKITIAYTDTAYINKYGNKILKSIKPEIDIMQTGHWNQNFINDGKKEIKKYAYLNCTIANVSSAIFKKNDYREIFNEITKYKQTGDYLFYIYVMSKGKIAYYNKPLNYYRVHGNNVTSTTKKQVHFKELKKVHKYIEKNFGLNKKQKKELDKRYKFLKKVWELDEK